MRAGAWVEQEGRGWGWGWSFGERCQLQQTSCCEAAHCSQTSTGNGCFGSPGHEPQLDGLALQAAGILAAPPTAGGQRAPG